MSRWKLFAAVTIAMMVVVPRAGRAEEEAEIHIVSPAEGTIVASGDPVVVEIALGPNLEGSPFSLRVDGKSVWLGQHSYTKSFDSAEWGEGKHWLQAAVLLEEEETVSSVVRVEVVAPEPEQPPELGEAAEAETGDFAGPAGSYREGLGQRPSTGGFELPFSDGFEDDDLDSSSWMRYVPTPGMEVVEFDRELQMSGQALSAEAGGAAATLKAFFNEPIDCSAWFRVQELGCHDSGVSLAIQSESGAVQVTYVPAIGYVLVSSSWHDRPRTALAFGDETSEWHQLRLTYDPSEGSAHGFVDGVSLGTVPSSIEGFAVSVGAHGQRYGCFVDVRFDDFSVRRLGERAAELPPPAEIVDEEPRWDRDPWLGVDDPVVPGQIVERRTPYGDYFEYVPLKVADPARVVVVVHGSPGDDNLIPERSRLSARNSIDERGWLLLADTKGVIIVAPSFDRDRFYGFRYLQGSPIGADDLVLRIVDSFAQEYPSSDGKLHLFGHSAGGQFANRFLVAHPERVLAAVISSAGTFAYPDDTVDWPFGRRNSPYSDRFLDATQLPLRVIVGSRDTKDISAMGEYQRGTNHLDRAEAWVEAMRQLAWENGLDANIEYIVVPGARHSAWALDISSVWWLAEIVDSDRAQTPETEQSF
jgi:pimeloyl-ACP methyl ester carboxylesterase